MTRPLNLLPVYDYSYSYSPFKQFVTVTIESAEPQFSGGYNGGAMELVASSPNNTTTFLTKESAATYVFSLFGQNLIDDINTVVDNTLTLGVLLFVSQDIQTVADAKVDKTITVNGHALSSNVTVSKSDVGLGSADNTPDASKPVSTATQTALDLKANISNLSTVATTGSYNDLSNKPSIPSVARTTSTLSLSLVGTGATGTQISSTKDSSVKVTVSTSATATIAGAATSTVTMKICSTNDTTEANWTTACVSETSQSYSLALALQGVTTGKGLLEADIPAGWYVKLVNTGSGTHSESVVSGQKTVFG